MTTIPTAQTSLDRLQRAGTRSPMCVGDVLVTHELDRDGIRISASSPNRKCGRIVTWKELAFAVNDPLLTAHSELLAEMFPKVKQQQTGMGMAG